MELFADDEHTLRKIVALFKNEGEILLSDAGKLTIPVTTLSFINRAFESVQDSEFTSSFEATPANTTKLPHYHEVQILYDFVQKLTRLKVSHRYTNPVAIDVTPFRSIRHLELRRIPIHLVNGISKVQNHLETISCTRCIASLQELFEHGGGDKSSPMSWSELQAAYLRENRIKGLDPSLRLVPIIKILDLSHNDIEETMNYLEYLTELTMLNLNYNKISKTPCLSVTCKNRIQVLLLKYNRLSHIDGVQELQGLKELDLRGNLIASHSLLAPLKPLTKLRTLKLDTNPICYHGEHRKLTIQEIHPLAVAMLQLDGKPFSKKEQKYCNYTVPSLILSPTRSDLLINQSDYEQSFEQSMARSYDGSASATTQSEPEIQVTSIRTEKKRKAGKKGKSVRKARKPDISDMDSVNWEVESVGAASSYKSSAHDDEKQDKLKEEIENMRTQLGSDWLQTRKVNPDQISAHGHISTMNSQPITATVHSSEQTESEKSFEQDSQSTVVQVLANEEKEPSQGSFKSVHSTPPAPPPPQSLCKTQCESHAPPHQHDTPTQLCRKKSTEHESLLWRSSGSETMLADFGNESEPFIVSSADDPDESYIVTVAEKFLLEKDINGTVTEQLDLSLLTQASLCECGSEVLGVLNTDGGESTAFCLKLKFNYVNKSKQERCYIMEDENSAQTMCELVQPTLNANKLSALAKDRLQCLKCGHEFNKHTASRHVRKSSFGGMKKSSSVGQQLSKHTANTLAEKGTLEEALTCPQCSSDMIIEMDPRELTKHKETAVVPPVSPLKVGFPLATSSAHSSPMKTKDGSNRYKPSEEITMARKKLDNSSAYATESSFQSCITEYSASYKSTSREADTSLQEPDPPDSYSAIAKTMRATLNHANRNNRKLNLTPEELKKTNPQMSGFSKSESETAKAENQAMGISEIRENESVEFPQVKLSNTKAWVDSNSDLGTLSAKSNSSTGILTRISTYDQGGKSRSDTNLGQDGDGSETHSFSREHKSSTTEESADTVLRGSGSDILVLEVPSSNNDTQSSSELHVSALNQKNPTKVASQSGSDLLILKDSLSQGTVDNGVIIKTQSNDSHGIKSMSTSKRGHLIGIVDPYCGQISLAGQLSRHPRTSSKDGPVNEDTRTQENEELEISMSESEPDSVLTTSDSYFSVKSSPKKVITEDIKPNGRTGSNNHLESSQEFDKSNPFYEAADEMDESNPFCDKLEKSRREEIHKTNPHHEEDIVVLDCKRDNHNSGSLMVIDENREKTKTEIRVNSRSLCVEEKLSSAVSVSSHRTLTRKLSSDIEVLTEDSASPSDTVLRLNESEREMLGNPRKRKETDDQLSPVGSLTDRTISNMLDFMKSSIYDSPKDGRGEDEIDSLIFGTEMKKGSQSVRRSPQQEELIQYNYEDFSTIDHRLKLHLMMNVFGSDEEEFQLLLRCGVLQYTKSEEFQGILVASSLKLYIFKVSNKEKPENIDKWLKLTHSQSLSELHYLDIGLGYQSFRVEFGLEATCFDLLIREELWCKTFVAQFTALLQDATFSSQSHLQAISKNNPVSLENLENQVILYTSDSVALDPTEVDITVVRFLKGFLYQNKAHKSPVSLVVTRSHICLAAENHKFPPPRCIADKMKDSKGGYIEVKVQQFNFKDRQRVTDLTRVEVFKKAATDAILYFMDDNNPEEFKWVISMTTERSLSLLLDSLSHVWMEHFGVDLQITTHPVTV